MYIKQPTHSLDYSQRNTQRRHPNNNEKIGGQIDREDAKWNYNAKINMQIDLLAKKSNEGFQREGSTTKCIQ